jgi:hypothetical protein
MGKKTNERLSKPQEKNKKKLEMFLKKQIDGVRQYKHRQ